jgi:hypothetical protein
MSFRPKRDIQSRRCSENCKVQKIGMGHDIFPTEISEHRHREQNILAELRSQFSSTIRERG